MLARRIIPQLLVRGRQLIKGKQFNSWRPVGDAFSAVKLHQRRQVDELILLDIGATPEGRGIDLAMVEQMADVCFSPLTVGGGVRTMQDIRSLLNHGADKVAIGTAAVENPGFVRLAADRFGSSTIVVSVDYRIRGDRALVQTHCGTRGTLKWVGPTVRTLVDAGAGEVLLTCIDCEGMMDGMQLHSLKQIAEWCPVPVVAAGGCGEYGDILEAFDVGADGVAIGALFQWTCATPKGAADWLRDSGYEVRTV